ADSAPARAAGWKSDAACFEGVAEGAHASASYFRVILIDRREEGSHRQPGLCVAWEGYRLRITRRPALWAGNPEPP
ncbi:MAG: hypothetical protein AAF804_16270, partial [Bacteroidota bacterium]